MESSGKKIVYDYKSTIHQDTEIKNTILLSILLNLNIHPLKFHVIKFFGCFLTQCMI